mmetsp:Transcript_4369/g.18512  ORF Transcript_4369/g.18512 Transcript_4369/m.18512 type:complete len:214 (-) Transcript_4369:274-915(-)
MARRRSARPSSRKRPRRLRRHASRGPARSFPAPPPPARASLWRDVPRCASARSAADPWRGRREPERAARAAARPCTPPRRTDRGTQVCAGKSQGPLRPPPPARGRRGARGGARTPGAAPQARRSPTRRPPASERGEDQGMRPSPTWETPPRPRMTPELSCRHETPQQRLPACRSRLPIPRPRSHPPRRWPRPQREHPAAARGMRRRPGAHERR